jgi:hypothetical protein
VRKAGLLVTILLPSLANAAQPQVGDEYEITRHNETSQVRDHGSSSTSDTDAIVERVIAVRPNGVEVEYDLPKGATAQDRAQTWQLPVRVMKSPGMPPRLLNQAELEARVERWLKDAKLPRSACGRWIFTWNAFRIECDPKSVLNMLEAFDPGPDDLRDGADFRDATALAAAPLVRRKSDPRGSVFVVDLALDPEKVRQQRAESDVVVAELSRKTLSLEAALRVRSTEKIVGTIQITLETNPAGQVRRKTRITKTKIVEASGETEIGTATLVIERRAVQPDPSAI